MLSLHFSLVRENAYFFLNIRLTHAELESDHSTTVYVKAVQTLLSDK